MPKALRQGIGESVWGREKKVKSNKKNKTNFNPGGGCKTSWLRFLQRLLRGEKKEKEIPSRLKTRIINDFQFLKIILIISTIGLRVLVSKSPEVRESKNHKQVNK